MLLLTCKLLTNPRFLITEVIVEEASQVSLASFLSVLFFFPTFKRLCFIGDSNQLPHVTSSNSTVTSVSQAFDDSEANAIFLARHYRMKNLLQTLYQTLYTIIELLQGITWTALCTIATHGLT